MDLLNLLFQNPLVFIFMAVPLLYAVIFHELAHGLAALYMGDPTAKYLGRLSLNPLRHLDLMGTLMLFMFGFGWAKPVPVNFNLLRDKKKGMILVSSAGIIVNMLLAFTALFLDRLFTPEPYSMAGLFFRYFAKINIALAAFNLIPLPPLDGSKILSGFLPPDVQTRLFRFERYGFFIVIGLLYFGVLNPVIHFFQWMVLSVINGLLPVFL